MELKNKKYVYNTGKLPRYEDGMFAYDKSMYYPRYTTIKDIGNVKTNISDISPNFKGFASQDYLNTPVGGISNFKKLPTGTATNAKRAGINLNNIADAIPSTIDLYGDVRKDFEYNDTLSSLNNDAGTSERNIGGLTYLQQNSLDYDDYIKGINRQNTMNTLSSTAKGAMTGMKIGSIFPGVGSAIGTIFGTMFGLGAGILGGEMRSEEAEKLANKQRARAKNVTTFNRSNVLSEIADRNYYEKYGDTIQQSLYGAAHGKQPEATTSPNGYTYGKATSMTGPGEILGEIDKHTGKITKMFRNPGIPSTKDTIPTRGLNKPNTFVITNIGGLSDMAANGYPYEALQIQAQLQDMGILHKYGQNSAKCGKLPKHYEGWVPNAIVGGLGVLGGLQQYLDASGQEIKSPNTYSSNRYEQSSISDLYRMKANPYPIMPEIHKYYDIGAGAIDRSGELRGGQKQLAKMKLASNMQNNIAKMLLSAQDQTNQYRTTADKAALASGSESARLKTAANQWDLDYYSKAHAARQQGMQMGIYNILNQLQQYYANDFKRRQFNDTLGLYSQQLGLDGLKLLHDLSNGGKDFAKNMEDYTKKQKNQYLINRMVTNPMFDPTKPLTYRNLTGNWLSGDTYLNFNPNGIRIR